MSRCPLVVGASRIEELSHPADIGDGDGVFFPVARCPTLDRAEGIDDRCRCEAGVLGSGELEQFATAVVLKQRCDIETVASDSQLLWEAGARR